MTPQEILNKAYLGVMRQGQPSVSSDGRNCVYRGKNGLKCAVGHLISDEAAVDWDKNPSTSLGIGQILKYDTGNRYIEDWMEDNVGLLSNLQLAHDASVTFPNDLEGFTQNFKRRVEKIAFSHGLKLPELERNME